MLKRMLILVAPLMRWTQIVPEAIAASIVPRLPSRRQP